MSMLNSSQVITRIRDAFILHLRDIFKKHPRYTYVEKEDGMVDYDKTKIIIFDTTPLQPFLVPAIIVSTVPSNEIRFVQNGDFFFRENETTDIIGSLIIGDVNIEILTLSTPDRDNLMDIVYDFSKQFTQELEKYGIAIINTSLEATSQTYVNDRWFYRSPLRMKFFTEYNNKVNYDLITKINFNYQLGG
jgi:hypothetical protein